jgi:hypothetical protein
MDGNRFQIGEGQPLEQRSFNDLISRYKWHKVEQPAKRYASMCSTVAVRSSFDEDVALVGEESSPATIGSTNSISGP